MFGGAKKKERRPRPDGGGQQQTRENLENMFGMPGALPGPEEEADLERELEMLMGGGNPRSKKRTAPKGGKGGGADIDAMVADIMRYVSHMICTYSTMIRLFMKLELSSYNIIFLIFLISPLRLGFPSVHS